MTHQIVSLSPEVAAFALAMQEKLDHHSFKDRGSERGWKRKSILKLANQLNRNVHELIDSIDEQENPLGGDPLNAPTEEEVLKEGADVGNFVMMLLDAAGCLEVH